MICAACLHLHQHHRPLQRLRLNSRTTMVSKEHSSSLIPSMPDILLATRGLLAPEIHSLPASAPALWPGPAKDSWKKHTRVIQSLEDFRTWDSVIICGNKQMCINNRTLSRSIILNTSERRSAINQSLAGWHGATGAAGHQPTNFWRPATVIGNTEAQFVLCARFTCLHQTLALLS